MDGFEKKYIKNKLGKKKSKNLPKQPEQVFEDFAKKIGEIITNKEPIAAKILKEKSTKIDPKTNYLQGFKGDTKHGLNLNPGKASFPSFQKGFVSHGAIDYDFVLMEAKREEEMAHHEMHAHDSHGGDDSGSGAKEGSLTPPAIPIPLNGLQLWLKADAGITTGTWNVGLTALDVTVAAPHDNLTGRYECPNIYSALGSFNNVTGSSGILYGVEDYENGAFYFPGINYFLVDNNSGNAAYYIPGADAFSSSGWRPAPSYVTRIELTGGDAEFRGPFNRTFTGQTGEDLQPFTGPNGTSIAYENDFWHIKRSNGAYAYEAGSDGVNFIWLTDTFYPYTAFIGLSVMGLTGDEAFLNGYYQRTYLNAQTDFATPFVNANTNCVIDFSSGYWNLKDSGDTTYYYSGNFNSISIVDWEQAAGQQTPTTPSALSSIATGNFTSITRSGSINYVDGSALSFSNLTSGQINGLVIGWQDQSGQGKNAITNGSIDYSDMQVQTISGNPFIVFAPHNQYGQLVGEYGVPPPLTGFPCTIITVANWPGGTTPPYQLMYTQQGSPTLQQGYITSRMLVFDNGSPINNVSNSAYTIQANRNYIYTASVSADRNIILYQNGAKVYPEIGTATCGNNAFGTYYSIGENGINVGLQVAEVIVYSRELSDSELNNTHAYLKSKYNIT